MLALPKNRIDGGIARLLWRAAPLLIKPAPRFAVAPDRAGFNHAASTAGIRLDLVELLDQIAAVVAADAST